MFTHGPGEMGGVVTASAVWVGQSMGVPGVLELFVLLSMLVPMVVFVVLVVWAVRYLQRREERRDDPAMQELRLALARGDISREEFEERRELLERTE
jgi:putative membrane protein